MTPHSIAFKARGLHRLVGPRVLSANRLAAGVGVPLSLPAPLAPPAV